MDSNGTSPMKLHCSVPVKTWLLESLGFIFFTIITGGLALPFCLFRIGEVLIRNTEIQGG